MMTAARYSAMLARLRAHPVLCRVIHLTAQGSVALVYLIYAGLLGWLVWQRDPRLVRAVLVPAVVFLTGTVLRAAINRPRPYEAFGQPPLFPKDTKGKSMPSRHSFSAAGIAVTSGFVWPSLGIVAGLLAVCIAVTRILSGVHYPSDVLAGLGFGAVVAFAGLYLI